MSRSVSKFRFKHFSVSHHRSSMKIGVDGVLIGAWTYIGSSRRILDVGTGCGVIALMMAQRAPEAEIDAIDIDAASIEEASENISVSPWSDRIKAILGSYSDALSLLSVEDSGYDLIVSNPPYFDSGVTQAVTSREKARHQGELCPLSLLRGARSLLRQNGSVAMVVPSEYSDDLEKEAEKMEFVLERKCLVRGHDKAPFKRSLLQWRLLGSDSDKTFPELKFLTLETTPGIPTDDYRDLCKDFYLRF